MPRFASQAGAATLLFDPDSASDWAIMRGLLADLGCPTITHARQHVSRTRCEIERLRGELRRALNMRPAPADMHPLEAGVVNMMFENRGGYIRTACRQLRGSRAALARHKARVAMFQAREAAVGAVAMREAA